VNLTVSAQGRYKNVGKKIFRGGRKRTTKIEQYHQNFSSPSSGKLEAHVTHAMAPYQGFRVQREYTGNFFQEKHLFSEKMSFF